MESIRKTDIEKPATLETDQFIGKENNDQLGGLESDEEYGETASFETDHISSQHSSLIADKYKEDMDAPTIANKLAEMIIDLECITNAKSNLMMKMMIIKIIVTKLLIKKMILNIQILALKNYPSGIN